MYLLAVFFMWVCALSVHEGMVVLLLLRRLVLSYLCVLCHDVLWVVEPVHWHCKRICYAQACRSKRTWICLCLSSLRTMDKHPVFGVFWN